MQAWACVRRAPIRPGFNRRLSFGRRSSRSGSGAREYGKCPPLRSFDATASTARSAPRMPTNTVRRRPSLAVQPCSGMRRLWRRPWPLHHVTSQAKG